MLKIFYLNVKYKVFKFINDVRNNIGVISAI